MSSVERSPENAGAGRGAAVDAGGALLPGRYQPLAAAATGLLMVLAFPRFGFDALIWVTLVPLFLAARGAGGRRGFALGYLSGAVLEGLGFFWISHALIEFTDLHWSIGYLLFGVWLAYAALIWGLLGWLLGRCRAPAQIHLAALLWLGLEQYFPRIFPWHVGGALWDREWLRQAADLFGAAGLSYAVFLVNAALYLLIEWRRRRQPLPRWTLGMAAALLIALPIYGGLRLRALDRELASAPEIRVGLLQPVLDPLVKDERFLDLLEETRAFVDGTRPDLMVWPEGMAPLPYIVADGVDPLAAIRRKHGGDLFDRVAVPIVIGGFGFWGPKERFSNTAAYILPSSAADRVRLYHKNKLLIFGERIPLEEHLPRWFRESVAVGTQKAGEGCPVMPLEAAGRPPARFRILICYEAVLQDYVRPLAEEREVDFLVNITEDLWYGRSLSSHTGQHESVLVLRAVENRMPIVRCTNAGPSEVIDAAGRRRERFEPFQRRLGVLGARIGGLGSVYKSGGHWFATLALGAGLGACCWRLFARRRSAAAESDARASQH